MCVDTQWRDRSRNARVISKTDQDTNFTAPFNNMRTLKFKAQRNVRRLLPASDYCRARRLDFRRSIVSGLSEEERGLISRTAAGNRAYRARANEIVEHSSDNETVHSSKRKTTLSVELWILQSACYWKARQWTFRLINRIPISARSWRYHNSLAYGSWARSTSGSQNLAVLPKRHDKSLFFFAGNKDRDNAKVALASSNS